MVYFEQSHQAFCMLSGMMLCLLIFFPRIIEAQVWQCSSGYTDNIEGKINCTPAGGIQTCGSDGNRYFSPRQVLENPLPIVCKQNKSGISPFVDMQQKNLARFGGTNIYERVVAPASHTETSKRRSRACDHKENTVDDVFSCFSRFDRISACCIEGLGLFVRETFLKASKALEQ